MLKYIFLFLSLTSSVWATEVVHTFEYGRFRVEVSNDGSQNIVGGIFTPDSVMPLPELAKKGHVIFVDYTTKELTYYRRVDDGSYEPVVGYAVVTPDPDFLPSPVVQGLVQKINIRPTWCPGAEARSKYPDLPSGCLPFGHPDNAMGMAKFEIIWEVDRSLKGEWSAIRLHGTAGYAEGSFWEDKSLGCVRLLDAAMEKLLLHLGPDPTSEGVQIIIMKGEEISDSLLSEGYAQKK